MNTARGEPKLITSYMGYAVIPLPTSIGRSDGRWGTIFVQGIKCDIIPLEGKEGLWQVNNMATCSFGVVMLA